MGWGTLKFSKNFIKYKEDFLTFAISFHIINFEVLITSEVSSSLNQVTRFYNENHENIFW